MNNFFYPAHHYALRDYLLEYNRLYAYPNTPTITDSHKIILDSGAFHMHKAKKPINVKYADKLLKHYEKYIAYKNVYCICADTPKNPYKTKQLLDYMLKSNPLICPVIQNPCKRNQIDLYGIIKQIKLYKSMCSSRFIAMSNNSIDIFNNSNMNALKFIVNEAKKYFEHFHFFGAGYNYFDVLQWKKTGCDSIDSISYYTDAKHGLQWQQGSDKLASSGKKFIELSLENLKIANKNQEY